ncbi:PREDICTED: MAM and LDL-receptor class A domain-containing protein 1-like isoform X2 [Priapulus caudatus]|uniref:MAM and LDL-receptor class A domain-containing protein 1-like isoform X2 n=1 Tax=Priapulus caudatus TaxID=37621 RepID=A0ABM1F989_PRICU|nr:PREDICTED: MAM and LDL-receptor class A domain-containing protein 1-like isoform X2 [Priapulus caudatus]
MCSHFWHQEPNDYVDELDWVLTSGGTPSTGTGPSSDHTMRTNRGHFIYVESSTMHDAGDRAQISSSVIRGTSSRCMLRFWYHMYGATTGSIVVYRRTSYAPGGALVLLSIVGEQGDFWHRAELEASDPNSDADFEVVIEGAVGLSYHSDIALDDLSMTPECVVSDNPLPGGTTAASTTPGACGADKYTCNNTLCYSAAQRCNFVDDCGDNSDEEMCGTDCDFENSQCGWYNAADYEMRWLRKKGSTGSSSTGPSVDHTLGSADGYYVYIETSGAYVDGEKARLHSANYGGSSSACTIKFFYHMYGKTIRDLRVLIKTGGGLSYEKIWEESGNKTDKWHAGEATIGAQREFAIVFEAIRGESYTGDIALDDITFENCKLDDPGKECYPDQFPCEDGSQCIEDYEVCNEEINCSDQSDEKNCPWRQGNCDFDADHWEKECNYKNMDGANFKWEAETKSPLPDSGPARDHTRGGTGKFLYINSPKHWPGDIAQLLTPSFPQSTLECTLKFWYHMYGSDGLGTLNVYTEDKNGQRALMWKATGNQGNEWQYAHIVIGHNSDYFVVFEATRGDGDRTIIALDDIIFSEPCLEPGGVTEPPSPCKYDQFHCVVSGECIPYTWVCDGDLDCADGTDEVHCNHTAIPTGTAKTTPWVTDYPGEPLQQGDCEDNYLQCNDGTCIAYIYECDGNPDCKHSEDELQYCPYHTCDDGYYFCRDSINHCIPLDERCNNDTNCFTDTSDEMFCSECMADFCKNSGNCTVSGHGPICSCPPEVGGNRCQHAIHPTGAPTHHTNWLVGVIITGSLLALLLIIAAVYYFFRRKQRRMPSGLVDDGVSNPGYGLTDFGNDDIVNIDTENLTTMKWSKAKLDLAKPDDTATPGALGIDNPLYEEDNSTSSKA